jgi:hypothetical protein
MQHNYDENLCTPNFIWWTIPILLSSSHSMVIYLENNPDKLHNLSKDTCVTWRHIERVKVNVYKFVTLVQDKDEWSATGSSPFGNGGVVGSRIGLYIMLWRKGHTLAGNQTPVIQLIRVTWLSPFCCCGVLACITVTIFSVKEPQVGW